jgi:indoleamine 2,3-dioxygenase
MAMTKLLALADYGIDAVMGFVPGVLPHKKLPPDFEVWDELAAQLPPLLRSRAFHRAVGALPVLVFDASQSAHAHERAMLVLSMFANAWVWGGVEPNLDIPAQIARPLCAVARRLDRPPIVGFASLNLYNWRKIVPDEPVSIDNATTLVQFLGGADEDWFFVVTLGVELAGAPMLPCVAAAVEASRCDDVAGVTRNLDALAQIMPAVQAALARMREWCDPHVFYRRVRPYVAGWPEPGAVYQGVSDAPVVYFGGSAGQSALIQSLDALLGIEHTAASGYLKKIRAYMPVGHRRFVCDVEMSSQVRAVCVRSGGQAAHAYDDVVQQVDKFRRMHMGLAMDYITKPSGRSAGEQGTGGTDFVDFLRDARMTTTNAQILKSD